MADAEPPGREPPDREPPGREPPGREPGRAGERSVRVCWGDLPVLEVVDRPGPLLSAMAPPPSPGEEPVQHRFLSGVALVAEHEGRLGDALAGADSFDGFLLALQAEGYRVEELTGP